jgi:hypothetical protein
MSNGGKTTEDEVHNGDYVKTLGRWPDSAKWDGTPSLKSTWLERVRQELKGTPEMLAIFDQDYGPYTKANYNDRMMAKSRAQKKSDRPQKVRPPKPAAKT